MEEHLFMIPKFQPKWPLGFKATILSNRPAQILRGPFTLALAISLAACGGMPGQDSSVPPAQNLGHDWRRHYAYGMQLLEEGGLAQNSDVFARAAFASSARFSRDFAPAYVGLGVSAMRMGNFPDAELAFLNAALIESRSRYWAWGAIAALQNGDEVVARAFYDGMQAAVRQEADPASVFVRDLYQVQGYIGGVERIPANGPGAAVPASLLCQSEKPVAASMDAGNAPAGSAFGAVEDSSDGIDYDAENESEGEGESDSSGLLDAPALPGMRVSKSTSGNREAEICRNLNIVTNVFFVRRYSSNETARGSDFFRELTFQLSAESNREWGRENGSDADTFLKQVDLSIPAIQYALRVTPQLTGSSVQVSAAPSVMTSIGNASEISEGGNLTILYNSSGDSQQFTTPTGMTLHLVPELATPDYVKLALNFEYSTVAGLQPSASAQVLDVAKDTYSVTGTFPYGTPVVLGTIASGTNSFSASGQKGLNKTPLLGGVFGASNNRLTATDTIVLGVLSEPEAFRGTRERRLIQAMRAKGIRVSSQAEILRRRNVHTAPDIVAEGLALLKGLPPV